MKAHLTIPTSLMLLATCVICLSGCNDKSPAQTALQEAQKKAEEHKTQKNTIADMRNMALGVTPEQLQLSLPAEQLTVYGVVMDWDIGNGVASVVSYQTGDASIYLSSGGGIIGGGQHANVNAAAKQFVSVAQAFVSKSTKTDDKSLPAANQVNFYLLTNKGLYLGHDAVENFENGSSEWLPLFEEGNKLLTELRTTSSNM